jgi:hypothetical protein
MTSPPNFAAFRSVNLIDSREARRQFPFQALRATTEPAIIYVGDLTSCLRFSLLLNKLPSAHCQFCPARLICSAAMSEAENAMRVIELPLGEPAGGRP